MTIEADQKQVEMYFGFNPHYLFAHTLLPNVVQHDPEQFFMVMASDKQKEYLQALLDMIEDNTEEIPVPFNANDIRVELMEVSERLMILLTMPKPRYSSEVYMVGIVLKSGKDGTSAFDYFTLELGRDVETGRAITFLCGWQGNTHLNYGSGFEPTTEAFIREIKKRIESDQESSWRMALSLRKGEEK